MWAVVVFILAVMWSVYIGMGLLSRRERRSMNSIVTFNRHLAVLARTGPARSAPGSWSAGDGGTGPAGGMTLAEARNRRRQVLTALAAAASITAALAFLAGGALIVAHLLTDLALGAYIAGLVRAQRTVVERPSTVVYLPRPVTATVAEPTYLRQSAN